MFLLRVRNDVPGLTKANSADKGGALLELTVRAALSVLLLGFFTGFCAAADLRSARSSSKEPITRNIGVDQFDKLRTNNASVILDVRTPSEFARGHIPGAVNIDWNGKDFTENVAALDKSHTYLVHCASGVRSVKACQKMEKLNFTNLYNLEGGFKAWEEAAKPVEKSKVDKEKHASGGG